MQKLIIISGLPASGKTAITARLALSLERGTRIEGDQLYSFVCRDYQSPIDRDGGECGRIFRSNCITLADNFLKMGCNLVINHIFSPDHITQILSGLKLDNVEVRVVWLELPLEKLLKRDVSRPEPEGAEAIHACWKIFSKYDIPAQNVLQVEDANLQDLTEIIMSDKRFIVQPSEPS